MVIISENKSELYQNEVASTTYVTCFSLECFCTDRSNKHIISALSSLQCLLKLAIDFKCFVSDKTCLTRHQGCNMVARALKYWTFMRENLALNPVLLC